MGAVEQSSGSENFDALKQSIDSDTQLRAEIEGFLRLVLETYNPSDQGTRFLTGAAAEWVLAMAAYSAGIIMIPEGHGSVGVDLMSVFGSAKEAWSSKSSSQKRPTAFRISNGMGGAGRGFVDPTIFMAPQLPGLVFAHPDKHPEVREAQQVKGDAVTLPFRVVRDHASKHPECVIAMDIPYNEGHGRTDPALPVIRDLVTTHQFPRLSKLFQDSNPRKSSVVDDLSDLRKMFDNGDISQETFDAACKKVVEG